MAQAGSGPLGRTASVMPTWNDPSPLANPLNSGYRRPMKITRPFDPSKLEVPNQDIPPNGSPEWYAMQAGNGLTVPNQDVPLGDQLRGAGFLPGSDRLFRLSDGSLIDFKTGRIASRQRQVPGYWGDPNKTISYCQKAEMENGTGPSMEDLIANMDAYRGTATPDGNYMDARSAAYWLKAQEEAEKLVAGMTDAQKGALSAFEAHFPKSKLIEESRKLRKGRAV